MPNDKASNDKAPNDRPTVPAWLGRHRIELRLGLRITVAGLLAFALAHLLELKQGYWAVLTAVIVVQANVGGSLKAASDRLIGTLAGGAYGVVIVTLIPQEDTLWRGAGLALALLPLAIAAAFRPGLRVAPVTAIIVLLGVNSQTAGALPSVIDRVIEIGAGQRHCLCRLAAGPAHPRPCPACRGGGRRPRPAGRYGAGPARWAFRPARS